MPIKGVLDESILHLFQHIMKKNLSSLKDFKTLKNNI